MPSEARTAAKPPLAERQMWVPLNDGTLKDLIAQHLDAIGILREDDEILKMKIGDPDSKGIRKIAFMFIKRREAQVILHE